MFTSFKPEALAAVALFQSTEETKYYLKGVYIEAHPDGGVIMTATDGHRLGSYHDNEAGQPESPMILPISREVLTALKNKKALAVSWKENKITVTFRGKAAADDYSEASFTAEPIDGTFPDWRRVVPEKPVTANNNFPAFNGSYLGDFGKAAALITGIKDGTVRILHSGDKNAALVEFPGNPDFTGVLMPIRT